jgi:hypothetical protein
MIFSNAFRFIFRLCLFILAVVGIGNLAQMFIQDEFVSGIITGSLSILLLDIDLSIEFEILGRKIKL